MTDINKALFNIDIQGEIPAAGKLLIAEPFLRDQYFTHSVICLIEYESTGTAMGIVMNRSTNYTLTGQGSLFRRTHPGILWRTDVV